MINIETIYNKSDLCPSEVQDSLPVPVPENLLQRKHLVGEIYYVSKPF